MTRLKSQARVESLSKLQSSGVPSRQLRTRDNRTSRRKIQILSEDHGSQSTRKFTISSPKEALQEKQKRGSAFLQEDLPLKVNTLDPVRSSAHLPYCSQLKKFTVPTAEADPGNESKE